MYEYPNHHQGVPFRERTTRKDRAVTGSASLRPSRPGEKPGLRWLNPSHPCRGFNLGSIVKLN